MLRYRSDLASLACILVSVSSSLAWLMTGRLWLLVPMFVALRWTALVQHNHSHLTLLRQPLGNRALDVALGTVTGMPMELYREAHPRTHHRYTGTPEDWTQPTVVRNRRAVQAQPLSRGRYLYVFAPRSWALSVATVRQDPAQRRHVVVESAAMAGLLLLPLLLGSPGRALPVVALWILVSLVSADANYKHHNGYLGAADPTEHTNDASSVLHTTLGFNIGYHSLHHRRPNAHWSKLPALSTRTAEASARQPT